MHAPRPAVLALPLLLGLGAAAPAADWSLEPHVGLNGEYNSNPYLAYGHTESRSGGTLDVLLPLKAKTETTDFHLDLGGNLRRYSNDPQGNRDDERLAIGIGQTHERSGWTASAGWTRDTTLTSELGLTGLTQSNKRHNRYDASISPQIQLSQRSLFTFGVSGELNRYEDAALTGLIDYGYGSVFANYQRQVSEVTAIGFGVYGGGLTVPDRSDSNSVSGVARLSLGHEITERLHLDAYVGPTYARSRTTDKWGAGGMLGLKYGGLRTNFSLSAERALAPAGLGALTVHDTAALSMSRRLTERLASTTTLAWQRSQEAVITPGAASYRVWYWQGTETLSWQVAQRWSLNLSVSGTRQASNAAPEFANRFMANLGIAWNPRSPF